MWDVFGYVHGFFKNREVVETKGFAFRILTSWTATIFFAFSSILTANEYVGNPIECMGDSKLVSAINRYCYAVGLFTVPRPIKWEEYEGVDVESLKEVETLGMDFDEPPVNISRFYMWVFLVFFLQAIAVYSPAYVWHKLEDGFARRMIMHGETMNESTHIKCIVAYIIKNGKGHRWYVVYYWMCEFSCLPLIICQMYAIHFFFEGQFWNYGLSVLNLPSAPRDDPLAMTFPRMAKCTFHMYGPSGTLQDRDAMCLLSLNMIHENMFIFIWFWFSAMAILSFCLFVYRLLTLAFCGIRQSLLPDQGMVAKDIMDEAEMHVRNLDIGEYWLLRVLSKNCNKFYFTKLVLELTSHLKIKKEEENGVTSN